MADLGFPQAKRRRGHITVEGKNCTEFESEKHFTYRAIPGFMAIKQGATTGVSCINHSSHPDNQKEHHFALMITKSG
jgi:hypothetical protein